MTLNGSVELPSNFSQDLDDPESAPPQRKLLQKVASLLISEISPAGQDSPVLGSNFSVE